MKNSIEAGLPAKTADRRISRTLLDCTKRLFSGNGKQKKSLYSSLSFSHYLFINSPIHYLANPPILFGKTLYNLAKLPAFAKLYRVLPKGFTFAKLYPTFAKSFILFGKRTPEQKFVLSRM